MQSLRKLFKIGYGPSSSHTFGPYSAAFSYFKEILCQEKQLGIEIDRIEVELSGSLALTGIGHQTDKAIHKAAEEFDIPLTKFDYSRDIIWNYDEVPSYHPNKMVFRAYPFDTDGVEVYSVGEIVVPTEEEKKNVFSYDNIKVDNIVFSNSMEEILDICRAQGIPIWSYVYNNEDIYKDELYSGQSIEDYLISMWEHMETTIKNGLDESTAIGLIYEPTYEQLKYSLQQSGEVYSGPLNIKKKACRFHRNAKLTGRRELSRVSYLSAYALAVMEENSSGEKIVTSPTFGSAGIVPSVLYFLKKQLNIKDERVMARALATGGLFGNLIKTKATISGAVGGCQAEVGTATVIAGLLIMSNFKAAAACQLLNGTLNQVEYAAEIALEHNLGLTCRPCYGLVIVPCIERNAISSIRALDSANYSILTDGYHRVSFDVVVEEMNETAKLMCHQVKETKGMILGGSVDEEHEHLPSIQQDFC